MNITVKVDEISLDTVVGEVYDGVDYDGDPVRTGSRTVAGLVAVMLVERLAKDDRYPSLLERFRDIRTEEIRAAVRPQVEQAIAAPIRKTNTYGEPTGQETTLRELIVDEARKALNEPADRYASGRDRQTILQKAVADEVKKALAAEIAGAVKAAREQVAAEIGAHVAAAVQAGLKAR